MPAPPCSYTTYGYAADLGPPTTTRLHSEPQQLPYGMLNYPEQFWKPTFPTPPTRKFSTPTPSTRIDDQSPPPRLDLHQPTRPSPPDRSDSSSESARARPESPPATSASLHTPVQPTPAVQAMLDRMGFSGHLGVRPGISKPLQLPSQAPRPQSLNRPLSDSAVPPIRFVPEPTPETLDNRVARLESALLRSQDEARITRDELAAANFELARLQARLDTLQVRPGIPAHPADSP